MAHIVGQDAVIPGSEKSDLSTALNVHPVSTLSGLRGQAFVDKEILSNVAFS